MKIGLKNIVTLMKGVLFSMHDRELLPLSYHSQDMNGLRIELCNKVVGKLDTFKQKSGSNEAGGMLFAEFHEGVVIIKAISTPCSLDLASPTSFVMNEGKMLKTIEKMYHKHGLHYVGDWHTHSEQCPIPSRTDINSIRKAFIGSTHELNYFILMIVSNISTKISYLSLTDGKREFVFLPAVD